VFIRPIIEGKFCILISTKEIRMIDRETYRKLISKRLTRLLYMAEAALPQNQYLAFRKLTLDEFGNNGLGKELDQIFESKRRDRAGINYAKEEVHHE